MKTKIQISLVVVAVFLLSIKLCSSTEDVINQNDFIKDHTVEIAKIIRGFNEMLIQTQPVNTVAAPPFKSRLVCIVSKDELTEIWNEIEKEENAEVDYPIKFTYSTNCSELEKIKTGILKLKHDYKALLKQKISSVKYEEIKAEYESEIRLLLKRLDDERASSKGEQAKIVEELQGLLQQRQDEINKLLKTKEDQQNALNEAYVELCVANINQNEIDKAVEAFNNITNYRQIKRIVSTTYSTWPESYEKIVLFVRQVSDPEPVLIGYTCLFEELKKQNQLRDMRILILANELRTNTELTFKELKITVMVITKKLIQINDLEGFIDYANTKGATRDMDFVKQLTPMIVKLIYEKPTDKLFGDDPRNVEFLLNLLLPSFSNLHHQLYVINDLITVMKEVGHTTKKSIFLVIHKVIEARASAEKIDDKYVNSLIVDIENNLPEGVRVFMSSNVCIKNLESGEFLFSSTTIYSRPLIATANLTNTNNHDFYPHIFIFTENDNRNEVQIRNAKSNELVSVSIFNPPYPEDTKFTLDIVSEGKFTIKSTERGYLIPRADIQSSVVIPQVSAFHFIDYLKQDTISQTNAIWLIKQCDSASEEIILL